MVCTLEKELHKNRLGNSKKWSITYLFCALPCKMLEMCLRVVETYRRHSSTLKMDSTVSSETSVDF